MSKLKKKQRGGRIDPTQNRVDGQSGRVVKGHLLTLF